MDIEPFEISVDDHVLEDLRRRLQNVRWPGTISPNDWSDGTNSQFLRELVRYWRDDFDWRAQEARLNHFPQFTAEIDGLKIHFIHVKGKGPDPMPLIITHGWPGSFLEMEHIIPMLADPAAHGGDAWDAFDVVVPSLPGYAFSEAPKLPGIGTFEIAGMWAQLMSGLGYGKFGAQGGDIGAGVSSWLAYRFPEQLFGVQLNYIPASYRPFSGPGTLPLTDDEQAFAERAVEWADKEGAYAHMHGTKPQTLSYAMTDSPVGLAAWLVEKFHAWSDCDGDVLKVFGMDTLLTEISIYWFSGSLDASFRLYKEGRNHPMVFKAGEKITPPLGVAHFAKELPQPPRSWVERVYNVTRWTEIEKGGHFAAMEQPEILAEEIRAHFRQSRKSGAG